MSYSDPASGGLKPTMTIAVDKGHGRTCVKVELHWAGGYLAGNGTAYRHPADCLTDDMGQKVATARALSDLADRLLAANADNDRAARPLTLVR